MSYLAEYEDMMGLEDMGGWITGEMVKEMLVASGAAGGSIVLASLAMQKVAASEMLAKWVPDANQRKMVTSALTLGLAVVGGRAVYDYNREAGIGIVAGLGGYAIASLLATFFPQQLTLGLGELSDSDDALLNDYNDGVAALASLEAANVQAAPGAFAQFADPTVTGEQLFGLQAPIVQSETLGYASYLS